MSGPLSLVYPVLAVVLWTFVMMLWTLQSRTTALRTRRVRLADIALSNERWPDDAKKISNNMHNQFETPLLFYVLCGVATYVAATDFLMTLLAWVYVATRLVHTGIHVTTNRVQQRFMIFAIGVAVLIAMWVLIVARLLMA